MEEYIKSFGKSVGTFCNHLQSSCDALKQSLDRRPIPLDSASSTFIQCLNRRVSSASSDLNLLESMSFGTVSFEELLGHCNEVYKKNRNDLLQLEDLLKSFGYVSEIEIDHDDDEVSGLSTPLGLDSKLPSSNGGLDPPSSYCGAVSAASSIIKSIEEDPLLDDSLNLRSLGLSDVCLATLASEGTGKIDEPHMSSQEPFENQGDKLEDVKAPYQSAVKLAIGEIEGREQDGTNSIEFPRPMVKVSKDDYENLPSYMKSLAPWEEMVEAVQKINSCLSKKGTNNFHPDEIASLGLGPKGRAYMLLLMRMNQLAVESSVDGQVSYRVL